MFLFYELFVVLFWDFEIVSFDDLDKVLICLYNKLK